MHTPGPWYFWNPGGGQPWQVRADRGPDADQLVAEAHDTESGTAQANAALIVSAPDLVETLRHIHNLAEDNASSPQDAYAQIEEWARHALEWAEGRGIEWKPRR